MKKSIIENRIKRETDNFIRAFHPVKEKQLKEALRRLPEGQIKYENIEFPEEKVDYFIPGNED